MSRSLTVLAILGLAGCAGPQSFRIAVPLPVQLLRNAISSGEASVCYVNGDETHCDDALLIPTDRIDRLEILDGRPAFLMSRGRATRGLLAILTRP